MPCDTFGKRAAGLSKVPSMGMEFQREFLIRLPLPLAQLYSRAFNAKDGRSRHDNTFYLFESLIKLTAATLLGGYRCEMQQGGAACAAVDRLLPSLALPSLGQWGNLL